MVFKMLFAGTASTIRAGESLNGSLQICATQETPAQQLLVELVGEECASVAVREGKRRRRSLPNREATQVIYRKEIDTTRMNHMIARRGAFPEGSCEVEFSIALPASLPGSTRITHGNGSAKIEYSLRAVLKGSGTCISHKAEKAVRVRALPPTPEEAANVPRLVKPRCQPVGGTFRHHGQVFCGAQAKQSLLQPGQEIDIDLAVLNQSKTRIRTVRVVLRERVRWSAQRASKTVMTNLVTHSVDAHSAQRSSLLGNSSTTSRRRGSFFLLHQLLPQEKRRDQEQSLRRVVEQLGTKDDNLLSFRLPPVPAEARNTHVGTRLCVTHEVIITLQPEGCWKRNPEVRIPVRIFNDDDSIMDDHNSLEPHGKEPEEESLTTEDLTTSYNSSLELEASNSHVETKWLAGGACPAPAPALDSKDAGRRPNFTISASA